LPTIATLSRSCIRITTAAFFTVEFSITSDPHWLDGTARLHGTL
jgi:hypothetical protein